MREIRQIKRFAVVGLLNTIVDLAVLNALIFATGRGHNGGFYFTIFKMISFIAAAANSYLLNAHWTFEAKHERNPLEVVRFLASSAVGFIINVTVASYVALHGTPAPELRHFWPSIAAITGTAIGLAWNFVAYKWIVFVPTGQKLLSLFHGHDEHPVQSREESRKRAAGTKLTGKAGIVSR
ncbi:MAG TPA: GtrA family protein [Terriglobales bacterium]|nr:GtrA family protein [Terriglobales bacterium]